MKKSTKLLSLAATAVLSVAIAFIFGSFNYADQPKTVYAVGSSATYSLSSVSLTIETDETNVGAVKISVDGGVNYTENINPSAIKLSASAETANSVTVNAEVDVTLTINNTITSTANPLITYNGSKTLTVTGSGWIDMTDGCTAIKNLGSGEVALSTTITGTTGDMIINGAATTDTGTITITSGRYSTEYAGETEEANSSGSNHYYAGRIIYNYAGAVTINGGELFTTTTFETYLTTGKNYDRANFATIYNRGTGKITVNDGTICDTSTTVDYGKPSNIYSFLDYGQSGTINLYGGTSGSTILEINGGMIQNAFYISGGYGKSGTHSIFSNSSGNIVIDGGNIEGIGEIATVYGKNIIMNGGIVNNLNGHSGSRAIYLVGAATFNGGEVITTSSCYVATVYSSSTSNITVRGTASITATAYNANAHAIETRGSVTVGSSDPSLSGNPIISSKRGKAIWTYNQYKNVSGVSTSSSSAYDIYVYSGTISSSGDAGIGTIQNESIKSTDYGLTATAGGNIYVYGGTITSIKGISVYRTRSLGSIGIYGGTITTYSGVALKADNSTAPHVIGASYVQSDSGNTTIYITYKDVSTNNIYIDGGLGIAAYAAGSSSSDGYQAGITISSTETTSDPETTNLMVTSANADTAQGTLCLTGCATQSNSILGSFSGGVIMNTSTYGNAIYNGTGCSLNIGSSSDTGCPYIKANRGCAVYLASDSTNSFYSANIQSANPTSEQGTVYSLSPYMQVFDKTVISNTAAGGIALNIAVESVDSSNYVELKNNCEISAASSEDCAISTKQDVRFNIENSSSAYLPTFSGKIRLSGAKICYSSTCSNFYSGNPIVLEIVSATAPTVVVESANGTTETEYYTLAEGDKGLLVRSGSGTYGNTYTYTPYCNVTHTLTNLTASPSADSGAYLGSNYSVTLSPVSENFILPIINDITVTIGGVEANYTNGDFTYDRTSGVLTISGEKLTGDLSITAAGINHAAHDLQHFAAVAATENTEGNIEYWYCTICGKFYSDENATVEITESETIIAELGYFVTFVGGEVNGVAATGTAPTQGNVIGGTVIFMPNNTFFVAGYTFSGWYNGTDTFDGNEEYVVNSSTVFTAQWVERQILGITIVDLNNTVYTVGSGFDYNSATIGALFDNGETVMNIAITAEMLSNFDTSAVVESATAVIEYLGKTKTFTYSVIQPHTHGEGDEQIVFDNSLSASTTTLGAHSHTTNYVLENNITNVDNLTVYGTVNLCLNGYVLNMGTASITVFSGATLNIYDCSVPSTGCITGGKESTSGYGTIYFEGDALNIYGGTVTTTDKYNKAIYNKGMGTISVYGGTVSTTTAGGGEAIYNDSLGTVNIFGGTVSGINNGKAISNHNDGIINITGGTISTSGGIPVYNFAGGTINISGGTISAVSSGYGAVNNYSGVIKISGGSISNGGNCAIYYEGTGSVYLCGTPAISAGTVATVNIGNGKLYANNGLSGEELLYYSGENISVFKYSPTVGFVVVNGVNAENKDKFSLTSLVSGYTLRYDQNNGTIVYSKQFTEITLVNNEGLEDEVVTAEYEGVVTNYSITERDGYYLNGYYTALSDGDKLIDADGTLIASIEGYTNANGLWIYTATALTLYAQWTLESYNVVFETFGGSTLSEITVSYGGSAILNDTIKDGYTFEGWRAEQENGNGSGDSINYAWVPDLGDNGATVTVYAKWTINQYNYTFYDDDEMTVIKTERVDFGTVITPPQSPTKNADDTYTYTFDRWNGFTENMTLPSENITFTAEYISTYIEYTVAFNGDKTEIFSSSYHYGDSVTVPEAPSIEGFEFKGWSIDGGNTVFTTDTEYRFNVSENITFTAVYAQIIVSDSVSESSESLSSDGESASVDKQVSCKGATANLFVLVGIMTAAAMVFKKRK